MNRPNAANYSDDLEHFRALCAATGLSTREIARRLGINDGQLRGYLSGRAGWSYLVQYGIEQLAGAGRAEQSHVGRVFVGTD